MIIDCHSHVLNENSFQDYLGKCNADIILCVKFFKGFLGGEFDNRDEGFDAFVENHENIYEVVSIDFNTNILEQLDNLKIRMEGTNKIKGIKLYSGYQGFQPYHERLLSVYHFAGENKLPVIFHSGSLYGYKNSEALLQYSTPVLIDEVAVKFPETTFIISHFGFPYMLEAAMVANKNNNVYVDISGVLDEDCYEVFKEDIRKVLKYYSGIVPQIMFGTGFIGNDTVQNEVGLYIRLVEEIFTFDEIELVFYKNAQKVFKL